MWRPPVGVMPMPSMLVVASGVSQGVGVSGRPVRHPVGSQWWPMAVPAQVVVIVWSPIWRGWLVVFQ